MFRSTSTPLSKKTRQMDMDQIENDMSPFKLGQLHFDMDELSLNSDDIEQLMTPRRKDVKPLLVDEDSGLGMDPFDKRQRRDSKESPIIKRRKHTSPTHRRMQKSLSFGDAPKVHVADDGIRNIVDRLTEGDNLIGDGTAVHSLPTIPGRHADLKSITSDTVSKLLEGKFDDVIDSYQLIDCRYPYEYDGGHVKGAVNLYKVDDVNTILESRNKIAGKRHILIFYCEFSSERGPKMYRNVRNADRILNKENYPQLNFPEMYLMHNGYKNFFENHKSVSVPEGYKPMLHKDHASDLRHFRSKSKSFTAGEKKRRGSRLSF